MATSEDRIRTMSRPAWAQPPSQNDGMTIWDETGEVIPISEYIRRQRDAGSTLAPREWIDNSDPNENVDTPHGPAPRWLRYAWGEGYNKPPERLSDTMPPPGQAAANRQWDAAGGRPPSRAQAQASPPPAPAGAKAGGTPAGAKPGDVARRYKELRAMGVPEDQASRVAIDEAMLASAAARKQRDSERAEKRRANTTTDDQGNPVSLPTATPAPADSGFGRPRRDPLIARRESQREKNREEMAARIDAEQQGDERARARGSRDMADEQTKNTPRHILAQQFSRSMMSQFGEMADPADPSGGRIPDDYFLRMYAEHSVDGDGNVRSHRDTMRAINESGALMPFRAKRDRPAGQVPLRDRQLAVRAAAGQQALGRAMAGPRGPAILAQGVMGARDEREMAQVLMAAGVWHPGMGNAGLALAQGQQAAALQAAEAQNNDPIQRARRARAANEQQPMGADYIDTLRNLHTATLPPGAAQDPMSQHQSVVNGGAAKAAEAARKPERSADETEGLRQWTQSFVAAHGSTNPSAQYQAWLRRLGLSHNQQSVNLFTELTGIDPRTRWEKAADNPDSLLGGVVGIGQSLFGADWSTPPAP